MLYLKKADLAKTYHISEKTVTNWIRESKDGKLELQLHEQHGKAWIANTTRNIELVEQLVEKGRKFRNSRGVKTIAPKPEFYKLYNQQQVFDISSNLDICHEIPFHYGYFDGGAEYWDILANRHATEKSPNNLNSTVKQLNANRGYIDDLLARYKRVNVVDIGVGNALPVRGFLQHLVDQDKMGRYIAVDISPAMLRIARENIENWFDSKVLFEGFEADINYDRFAALLTEEVLDANARDTVNAVLALGSSFTNLRSPDGAFKVIHDSMNRNDLFVYNLKLDSEAARRYFDFAIGEKLPPVDAKAKMMLDLLDIDESFYEVEMGYDEQRRERYIRIRLKVALNIVFTFDKGDRTVELNKGDAILLWRSWHYSASEVLDQLDRSGFDTLQSSLTEDKDYLLTISRVKRVN